MPSPLLPITTRPWRSTRRLRRVDVAVPTEIPSTDAIFLVLRRMRGPLIILVMIFSVAVLGLSLIPGVDSDGNPWRMTLFDAFYFVSYTATTIGFGEIPYSFSTPQRMWVTGTIFASVTGWAYVFGTLFALMQEEAFRKAVNVQRFRRKVQGLHEPFLLIAGYGQAGRTLAHALDRAGRRIVVIDSDQTRIDLLTTDQLTCDVPALQGDLRNPALLGMAGLAHPQCEGIIALTTDDEVNLAVVMAAHLLATDVPVITRCSERANLARMNDFSPQAVINPYDRYGNYLTTALNSPSTYQLSMWLMSEPGTDLPPLHDELHKGRWLVSADDRFGHEVATDLRRSGLEVTEINPSDGMPEFDGIVGFVAGSQSDTTNLSMAAHARLVNPDMYLAIRQKSIDTTSLLQAFSPDSVFIAPDLVALEALARLESPMFWGFVEHVQHLADEDATRLRDRLVDRVGPWCPVPKILRIDSHDAPAITRWFERGNAITISDLLHDPDDRERLIPAFCYMHRRGDTITYLPQADVELQAGDQIGFLARNQGLDALRETLTSDASLEYLVTSKDVPTTWLWRKLLHVERTHLRG